MIAPPDDDDDSFSDVLNDETGFPNVLGSQSFPSLHIAWEDRDAVPQRARVVVLGAFNLNILALRAVPERLNTPAAARGDRGRHVNSCGCEQANPKVKIHKPGLSVGLPIVTSRHQCTRPTVVLTRKLHAL